MARKPGNVKCSSLVQRLVRYSPLSERTQPQSGGSSHDQEPSDSIPGGAGGDPGEQPFCERLLWQQVDAQCQQAKADRQREDPQKGATLNLKKADESKQGSCDHEERQEADPVQEGLPVHKIPMHFEKRHCQVE